MIGFDAFLAVFFATVILVLKPGPQELTVASLAASGKFHKIMSFFLGSWTAGTIVYIVLLTSLSFIAQFDLGFIFFLLRSLAATWFIYLGVKWLLPTEIDDDAIKTQEEKLTKQSFWENFGAGFILTASNPYDVLFVTGVIPSLVGQNVFTIGEILSIRMAVIGADFITTTIVCVVPVLLFKKYLNADNTKFLKYISGVLLIGVGMYVGYNAIMADDLLSSGILN